METEGCLRTQYRWEYYVWYIYLLQLGFHPVAVIGRHVQKLETDSKKGETIHKKYKNNTNNKEYTKQKIKKNWKQKQA